MYGGFPAVREKNPNVDVGKSNSSNSDHSIFNPWQTFLIMCAFVSSMDI